MAHNSIELYSARAGCALSSRLFPSYKFPATNTGLVLRWGISSFRPSISNEGARWLLYQTPPVDLIHRLCFLTAGISPRLTQPTSLAAQTVRAEPWAANWLAAHLHMYRFWWSTTSCRTSATEWGSKRQDKPRVLKAMSCGIE